MAFDPIATLADALRPLVEITLRAEPDDTAVRGNALASGDDATDRAAEREILERLANGDTWAWAHVTVAASIECGGRTFTASDMLGCCSYASEAEFRADPYYADMCTEAIRELAAVLVAAHVKVSAVLTVTATATPA